MPEAPQRLCPGNAYERIELRSIACFWEQ